METNAALTVTITKYAEEEGLCSGWANVALDIHGNPVFDWQGDIIHPAELEKAAVNFMLDFRASGEMHAGPARCNVVESMVFTKEKQAAIGIPEGHVPEGWFITIKIDDPDLREAVKSGKYRMFSIQGRAQRVEI